MDGQAITWVQILQVGGLAGVVSALFSVGVRELFEWLERKRRARYLALRLSLVLEDYYHACTGRVYDIENYHSSEGDIGRNDAGLPDLADYPADPVAWMYLNNSIADEVLSLPAAIRAIDEGIHFDINLDRQPDGPDPELTLEPLYEMAFRSIELARRVRLTHGLSETNRTRESEVRLKENQERLLQALRERRERDQLFLSQE
jgi:hypothetical protein